MEPARTGTLTRLRLSAIRRPTRSAPKYLLIAISCIGWVTNHFTGTRFHNQSDISAAVGALAVGFVANIYGRFFNGSAFVVMVSLVTGALLQV